MLPTLTVYEVSSAVFAKCTGIARDLFNSLRTGLDSVGT